jgi:D-alanine-D-alanine ligase
VIVQDELELEAAVEDAFRIDDEALVERTCEGRTMCVGLFDGTALGAMEVPGAVAGRSRRLSLVDRTQAQTRQRLSTARMHSILRLATLAYEALGCEGAACVDLVVSERSNEIIVDIDTAPALTPASVLPQIAASAGLPFGELIEEILEGARIRAHGHRRNRRSVGVQAGFEGPERREGLLSTAHH